MSYPLITAITLNRFSTFKPLTRYFSFQISNLGNTKKWWRPGTEDIATDDIKPYNITFSEKLVNDLKYKLKNSEILKRPWLDKAANMNGQMIILSNLLHHWAYRYNFKAREENLNSIPHFMTNIQGLDIHFIRLNQEYEKEDMKTGLPPILFLHGWPNSITEFYELFQCFKIIEFPEIIIPSLPGFGFSSAPTISGFSCIEMSVVLKNLMLRLGHNTFMVFDGYGDHAINGRIMSVLFPQDVTMDCNISKYKYWKKGYLFSKLTRNIAPIEKVLKKFGYSEDQASEMNTIAIDLNNSPTALAAYYIDEILNRTYSVRSFKGKNLLEPNFYTNTIDNLMMYWAPKCINTAMQVHAERHKNLPNEVIELLKNL